MYDTILLPVDGSESSLRGADHTFTLADQFDATVHVLSVVDTSRYGTAALDSSDLVLDELEAAASDVIEEVESEAADRGVSTESHLARGQPYKEIMAAGEAVDADLIVIGHKGLSQESSAPIGSVAERVAREATRPILIT